MLVSCSVCSTQLKGKGEGKFNGYTQSQSGSRVDADRPDSSCDIGTTERTLRVFPFRGHQTLAFPTNSWFPKVAERTLVSADVAVSRQRFCVFCARDRSYMRVPRPPSLASKRFHSNTSFPLINMKHLKRDSFHPDLRIACLSGK